MRYRVLDLPVKGAGAFTPLPFTNPTASSFGTVKTTALLGLTPIPVPAPTRVWAPPISADKATQPSNVAPDAILRDVYTAHANNMGPEYDAGIGMTIRRLCPLPVPAVGLIYSPRNAFHRPSIGGRAQLGWPRAFQRFPNRGSR